MQLAHARPTMFYIPIVLVMRGQLAFKWRTLTPLFSKMKPCLLRLMLMMFYIPLEQLLGSIVYEPPKNYIVYGKPSCSLNRRWMNN